MAYPFQESPRTSIVPLAGQLVTSRLINGVQTHFIDLVLTGTVTIGTAVAAAIRNRGSLWAAIDEVQLVENGTQRVLINGRVARFLAETAAPSALAATRLTSTAIGATQLREIVRLYFAHPFAAHPRETAFKEHDTRQVLEVGVKLAASGGADKLAQAGGGGGTVTLTNLSVEVMQALNGSETKLPFFIPNMRQQIAPVTGANAQLIEYIKTTNALRSVVLSPEDTIVGEVSDIINKVTFKGDFRDILGPSGRTWQSMIDAQGFEFGGNVSSPAHWLKNFQFHGKLADLMNPNQDANLRIEFDCQPSVSGQGTSQIRITLVELVADPQLCAPLTIPV